MRLPASERKKRLRELDKENHLESVLRRQQLRLLNASVVFEETRKDFVNQCDHLLKHQYTERPPTQSVIRFKTWCSKDFYLTYIWSIGSRESTLIKGQFWWVHKIYNIKEQIDILPKTWFVYQDKGRLDSNGYKHTNMANVFHKKERRNRRKHCALYYNPQNGTLRMSFSVWEFFGRLDWKGLGLQPPEDESQPEDNDQAQAIDQPSDEAQCNVQAPQDLNE
jgi:hypothetical protein